MMLQLILIQHQCDACLNSAKELINFPHESMIHFNQVDFLPACIDLLSAGVCDFTLPYVALPGKCPLYQLLTEKGFA